MTISGSTPPSGGLGRAAQAYGIVRKPAAPPAASAPTEATDKAEGLRSVLNDEERAYFDQLSALGPVTYGPGRRPGMVPGAPRGLRLDVRA